MSLNLFLSQFLGVGLSFIEVLLKLLAIVVPLLISVAYFTLAERKIMGTIQRRKGPNVVGFQGLLQPLADGLKLFVKETILPSNATKSLFLLAPMISWIFSSNYFLNWSKQNKRK